MTEPGWYHGEGDPADTMRYWDGAIWSGEPQPGVPTTDIAYYAPAVHTVHVGDSPTAPGAVTYRATPQEAPVVDAPIVEAPPGHIPASAQLVAIGLSALKAVGLAFMLLNTVLVALFGTLALTFRYNEDVENLLALTVGISLLVIAIGTALLMTQALGAARNRPGLMLAPALLMTGWDGLLTIGSWVNDHGTDQYFYTGLFLLQGWVLVGAVIGLVKRLS